MHKNFTYSIRGIGFSFAVFLHFSVSSVYGQLVSDRQQKMRLNVQNDQNVSSFKMNEELKTPAFITFKENSGYTREKAPDLIKKYYQLASTDALRSQEITSVSGGLIVERYKQFRNGIKVEHGAYIVTSRDSKVFSINAESFDLPAEFSLTPRLKEQQAKDKVLSFVNAKQYAWQVLEQQKSKIQNNATELNNLEALIDEYSPKGELVISKALYQGGQARLAYKFDIYATEPLSRSLIYVDANTGEILLVNPIIKHAANSAKPKTGEQFNNLETVDILKRSALAAKTTQTKFSPLRIASELGKGQTRYAGIRDIFTTKISVPTLGTPDPNNALALLTFSGVDPRIPIVTPQNVFILKDDTRGGGIETYDMNGLGGLPISVPSLETTALAFVDKDNNWKNETTGLTNEDLMRGATQPPAGGGAEETFNDDMAIDAHWGAEMVYDYWKARHGRLSYDNANTSIRSYVHYGPAYDNAFWNGSVMTYGDGSGALQGGFKPLVSLDVCAHEIGHGVCSSTADLVYQSESGAMNEGLSDIWAAALENYALLSVDATLPYQAFQVGEQIDPGNEGLRRMDDPKKFGNPDSYGGTNWVDPNCTPTLVNDQCGVHNNSGVLNKWFYLVVKGPNTTTGSPSFTDDGINDAQENYGMLPGFIGLGFEKAEKITYLMELMLTPNATYADARTASINAAVALYGVCSQEEISITDAWYAVNVGDAFTSCTAPLLSARTMVTEVSEFAAGACDRYKDYAITTNLTAAQTNAVTVNFSISGGTSGANESQLLSNSVTYNAGQTGMKTVMLRIFDDAMVEGEETINILATSTLDNLNTTLTVKVLDDDVTPVIGGTVTLISENFESTANNALPTGWQVVDKITPSPVAWKVLPAPAVSVLSWTTKRAVIEAPLLAGQATYDVTAAAQTILRTPVINTLGLSDVKVSFTYSVGGEPACSPACDFGQLVYSYDGVNFSAFTNASTTFYLQLTDATANITLPEGFNNSTFYLGFLWNNDASAGAIASVTIDNVVVTASGRTLEGDLNATVQEKVFPETDKPVYFYSNSDHQLMAGIVNANANLGCVSTTVSEAGNGGTPYLSGNRSKKVFTITPSQNPSAQYTLSLYFKTSELSGGFSGAPSSLKLVKSNAAELSQLNNTNSVIVTPVFEDHATEGYYKYTYTFTGFSRFFVAENIEGALPVTLADFKVQKFENTAKLNWTTTSEINSESFEIERSFDATHFSIIGNVKSSGNSGEIKTYEYADQSPVMGLNYYRLKMIDTDGTFGYSKILPLEFRSDKNLLIYPNPVSNKVTVQFDSKLKAGIRLLNAAGQIVKIKTTSGLSAELDVSDLPDGLYVIEISPENGMKEVRKLLIKH